MAPLDPFTRKRDPSVKNYPYVAGIALSEDPSQSVIETTEVAQSLGCFWRLLIIITIVQYTPKPNSDFEGPCLSYS